MEEETEVGVQEATPKGRAAIIELYKAEHPGTEPTDDELLEFIHEKHSGTRGELDNLNGANSRLAEVVGKDPRTGSFLSMISGDEPTSVPFALSKTFGKDVFEMEGADLEEFERGYQENLQRLAESDALQQQALTNIQAYEDTLNQFGAANGLSEEQMDEINSGVMQFADNILMGNISQDVIDIVYKGLNYERDVQDAADAGVVEGKNAIIEAKIKKKKEALLPDLGNATGAGGVGSPSRKRGGSFFDEVREV